MKKDRKRMIWLVLLVMYMAFIYSNSLTPAVESSRQSGRVLLMVQNFLESLGIDSGWLTEHIIRKTAHFLEYGGLGFLVYHGFWNGKKRVESLKTAGIVSFFVPFVDETLQLFTEGRSGQISDVWLDMTGAAAGFLVAALLAHIIGRRKS